ncbi:DNA-binding MarR family transcriptional regulator [Nocardiopsis mwathae]|uniref:DNA-binding MarR family transcriptional regulator n=1 Tax=Nocardiopsis mwathae TaxID=1472723 RepID=A0A7W9YIS9_9ACTN|nr:MarR family transcriptional regulator [Nocardiopsis mwathae]MBB6172917.1 DNA-binding MarR family transcriptional regulator [Nocardiopsis mwathae]
MPDGGRRDDGAAEHDAVDEIIDQWRTERPDLDAEVMAVPGRIWRAAHLLSRAVTRQYAEHGLEGWEFDVLATLRRSGPPYALSGKELSAAAMITSGAITNRVDRLVGKGLVERNTSPHDRRTMLVSLTAEGRRLADEAVEAHVDNEKRLLAALSPEDRESINAALRRLLVSLGDTSLSPAKSDTGH